MRAFGAAAIAAGLFGVFALPAYAAPGEGTLGDANELDRVYAQALSTSALPEIAVPSDLPSAEEEPLPIPAALLGAGLNGQLAAEWAALPAGSGVAGIVNAALAQVGLDKDCTDVAQDALAAVGIVQSRFSGGPDLGVSSFARYGTVYAFSADTLAPGDLLVYPEGAHIQHIAVYVGGGQAVHGGWHPTALAGLTNHGEYPTYVVRVG